MQHLDEGTIHAWLDGALDATESARAAEHVEQCAECAAAVAEARGLIAGASRIVSSLDVVRGGVIPATPGSTATRSADRSLWRRLHLTPARAAIAATILVAGASLLSVRTESHVVQPALSERDAAPPVPATIAPSAAAPVAQNTTAARAKASPPPPVTGDQRAAGKVAEALRDVAAPRAAIEARNTAFDSAVRARVADTSKLKLQEVVVTSAAPPTADSAVRRRDTTISAQRVQQLEQTRMTGAAVATRSAFARPAAPGSDGCYELASAEIPAWAKVVPARFALDLAPADSAGDRRMVRSVTRDMRMGAPIPESSWTGSGNTLNVTWPADVTLVLTRGSSVGTLKAGHETVFVPIRHTMCTP